MWSLILSSGEPSRVSGRVLLPGRLFASARHEKRVHHRLMSRFPRNWSKGGYLGPYGQVKERRQGSDLHRLVQEPANRK